MVFLHLSAQCAGHQHNDFIQIIKKTKKTFFKQGVGAQNSLSRKILICSTYVGRMFNFNKSDVQLV